MTKIVDAKGKNCPIPVVMAKKEIDAGCPEFTVEVDNQTAVENLKKLAKNQGYSSSVSEAEGVYYVDFVQDCEACNALLDSDKPQKSWAVFVPRDTVGDGAEELGKSLMKMFFYTLSQSDDLPDCILFMNAGVKLPVGDEQVIEHLKSLAEKGVDILVCGTCLNFYGLSQDLKIGTVSNMYDIVSRMQKADKVLTV